MPTARYVNRPEQVYQFGEFLTHDHVHIPKTGGGSITQSLFIHASRDPLTWRMQVWPNYLTEIKTISIWIRDP